MLWFYGSVFYINQEFKNVDTLEILTSIISVVVGETNTFVFIYIHIDAVDIKI